jgi:hypothetical protein
MKKFIWEPGNATRYTIYFASKMGCGEHGYILMLENNRKWMHLSREEIPHVSYIEEKLGLNRTDAWAIVHFLEAHRKDQLMLN